MSLQGQPVYCAQNCGFYGNPATLNMCSKCYQEMQKKNGTNNSNNTSSNNAQPVPTNKRVDEMKIDNSDDNNNNNMVKASPHSTSQAIGIPSRSIPIATKNNNNSVDPMAIDMAGTSYGSDLLLPSSSLPDGSPLGTSPAGSSSAPRCFTCNKRLGLTGFKCRCEHHFCPLHRHANAHNCTFDYKSFGRDKIAKNNPTVVGSKLDKI